MTNGESTDFAHLHAGTLAWTPELEEGCTGCGFVFPDDEALVQAEFEKVLPFAQDVVASAADPANPVSHLGIQTKPFYLESDDTFKAGLPLANFKFAVSYGDPQTVRVLALARPRQGRPQVPHQRRPGAVRRTPTNTTAASATAGRPTSTTTSSRAR